jgi:hypothetical protein
MSLVAAEELEKRETTQKEAAADRKWMFWGVMGAFATAFITMCTNISGDFFSHMLKILLFLLIF